MQSGGGRVGMDPARPLSGGPGSAEAIGVAFAHKVGIADTGAPALRKLRALPPEAVLNDLNLANMKDAGLTYAGGPVLDGQIMPVEPARAYAAGKAARVPLMVGANSADIGPMNGDQRMGEPARYVARVLASLGQPVYEYRFSYVAESLRKQWPGALHASDIPYAFDTVMARYGKDLTEQDAQAAHNMHAYWVAFAISGRPAVQGLPAWPAYDAQADTLMDFTNTGPVVGPDPWRARLDLAERVNLGHLSAP